VFTLTSCIGIGPNGIILPKKKRIYKTFSETIGITVPKGDFGKYVLRTGIPYDMRDEYEEILENSCNYYWTFYYEKHHTNGDTIFFMGIYLPDYNYLYLFEDEFAALYCQNVEYN